MTNNEKRAHDLAIAVCPFGSNEGKRTTKSFFLFSTISQTALMSCACCELHLHRNKILSLLPSVADRP